MSPTLREYAAENGYFLLLRRIVRGAKHRVRDSFIARRLRAPGFRAGSGPRLLGLAHMRIGANFRAGDSLWLEAITSYAGQPFHPQLVVGDNVSLSDAVHIACLSSITIGSGTLVGSRVLISDHAHGSYQGSAQTPPETVPATRPLTSTGAVFIGRSVWLGDGVAILAGASIGDGAIIGANSVVTGNIPAATIAVGAPARPIRQWDAIRREWLPL